MESSVSSGQLIFYLIAYLVNGLAFFKIFKKAGYEHAWLAFIPILSVMPFFYVIGRSAWNLLWFLIPLVNIYFIIKFYREFVKAYGFSGWYVLLFIVPIASYIFPLYIGFSSNVQYVGRARS